MKILLLDSGKGIIPFIKEILKQNKNNEYYLFMDHEGFPYGDKDELYLVNRLKYLLNEFNKLHIDLLLICCNTLSNIYLGNRIKTNYQIKTIFELNLANLHNNKILVTPSLKKFYINDNRFIACNLASSIENDNLTLSIQELKRLTFIKDKLILGCTHYPLIKDLFYKYLSCEIVSYESDFIAKIPTSSTRIFFGREYEIKIVKKYFPYLSIKTFSLS